MAMPLLMERVLVIGAGGIGCELLKTLVLSGVLDITIIDSDIVDKTNLNRQLLFREQHIGEPKATTAAAALLLVQPELRVTGVHADVTSPQFNPDFFRQFSLVLNALDNLNARKHVNRMCLAAKKPMIDAGTQGKLGQVSVHIPGETNCYECEPKPTAKTYPICTIRSTPTAPVHTIVWAKMLFDAVFSSIDNQLSDMKTHIEGLLGTNEVFEYLFCLEQAQPLTGMNENSKPNRLTDEYTEPGLEQSVSSFYHCYEELLSKKPLRFDKQNDLVIEFITSASNLRNENFSIQKQSMFKTREVAGNIIPAVATTNSIAAGLQVIQALNLLGKGTGLKNPFIREFPTYNKLITGCELSPPNPNCYVCSVGTVTLLCDLETMLLESFLEDVLRKDLGLIEPIISANNNIYYECGEGLDDDEVALYQNNLKKTLNSLGLKEGDSIEIDVQTI